MKAKMKNIVYAAIMVIGTIGMAACHRSSTTEVTRSTILPDETKPLTQWVNCSACSGKGSCLRCKGTGKISGKACVTCNGTGKCTVCNGEGGYRAN